MISKSLIVILLVNAISGGKLGQRSGLPLEEPNASVLTPNIAIGKTGQTSGIQQIERSEGIPSKIGTSLPITNFEVPQTIPQYLLSLPRTVNFEIPESVPVQLLTITSPGAVIHSFAVQPLPAISGALVSPAQKVRFNPIPLISSAPIEASVLRQIPQLSESPVIPESASIPRFESNVYSGSFSADTQRGIGFSTPSKPLNFAPILPQVNGQSLQSSEQITQKAESPRTEQIAEPVQQRMETPEIKQELPALPQQEVTQQRIDQLPQPLSQQRVEQLPQPLSQQKIEQLPQPLSQQRIEQLPQPLSQQRIEQLPQPLSQQRIEQLPQPLSQQRIDSSLSGAQSSSGVLSSYSF